MALFRFNLVHFNMSCWCGERTCSTCAVAYDQMRQLEGFQLNLNNDHDNGTGATFSSFVA